jgi:flagellar basal body rod protein FlgG
MGELIEVVGEVLSRSERQVEISAQNLSNISTPGYKRAYSFSTMVTATSGANTGSMAVDLSPGRTIDTHNPYDLAIQGKGFFRVRSDAGMLLTRQGMFQPGADGRVVTSQGYVLQTDDGGDLTLQGGPFQVQPDGVVIQDGQPVAKLAIVDVGDPTALQPAQAGMFTAPDGAQSPMDSASVVQGALESSNTSTADEMISMMEAVRRAETGQRLANVYDDLMGRILSTFGQS